MGHWTVLLGPLVGSPVSSHLRPMWAVWMCCKWPMWGWFVKKKMFSMDDVAKFPQPKYFRCSFLVQKFVFYTTSFSSKICTLYYLLPNCSLFDIFRSLVLLKKFVQIFLNLSHSWRSYIDEANFWIRLVIKFESKKSNELQIETEGVVFSVRVHFKKLV